MDFGANKTPVEVNEEGSFGGTYFRDIYSYIRGKWYKKSWKEFDQLKNIDCKYYFSDYHDVSVNKFFVKGGTLLKFWENNDRINEIDPYGWFQTMSIFRGKLVKMIKDAGKKFDDYSILPKTR